MRYGILSDVHGNLEALDATIEALTSDRIDVFVCLGDIVGYGPDPNECLERIWSLTSEVIAGNHDHAAVGRLDLATFNHNAAEAALWTMQRLTRTGRHYLSELPLTFRHGEVLAVHAAPSHPERWPYLLSPEQVASEFRSFPEDTRVCFVGHTHTPAFFEHTHETGCRRVRLSDRPVRFERRCIVNAGSVGQPRDGDPRAAYVVYDTDTGEIEIKRVCYDLQTTQKKMRRAGLPEMLAARLGQGR